jgi:hypothetical protein
MSPTSSRSPVIILFDGKPGLTSAEAQAALDQANVSLAQIQSISTSLLVELQSIQNDINDILADLGPSLPQNVNPTTLTEFDGDNKLYQGQVYYWTGSAYALVADASQITDVNEAIVSASGVFYGRQSDGTFIALDLTTDAPSVVAPDAPTATGDGGDRQVVYTVTLGASNGGAAITDVLLIWRPEGSPVDVEVSTELTANGTYTLTGLEDGQNPNARFVAVNASDLRSVPSAAVTARTDDVPDRYVLAEDDVTSTVGGFSIDLTEVGTNGPTTTNFYATVEEV